jgi:hypothetical protein
MTKVKVWHWIVIIIFIPFVLGSICPKKTQPPSPPPQPCGAGGGEYGASIVQSVPWEFDCNLTGSFETEFEPSINNSYTGFNRLYFTLKKGSSTYRSDYVEFYSNQEGIQQLEWGGSLPTGEYKATAFLKNIQLNSNCKDSIKEEREYDLGEVDITQFTSPEKVMYIEYDCQESDTLTSTLPRYDVFLSPHTSEYMNIAFNVANTKYTIDFIGDDYDPVLVEFTGSGMAEYIFDHKQFGEHMYLGGIKGFKDVGGNFIPYALGNTAQLDTITFTPSWSTGRLVAVKACINFSAPEYKVDYNDLVTASTVHELAHQRGIWGHHIWGSGPKFCRMNPTPWYPSGHNTHPHYAETYSNPHFCTTCINKIKSITW